MAVKVFLGLTESFRSHHHIRCISCGPGGHILAILSQTPTTKEWIFSLWLLENGLNCFLEFSVGQFQLRLQCLTSIIWHPSGDYIYLLIGGIVTLVTWKIMNPERKVLTLLDFISTFSEFHDGSNYLSEMRIVKVFDETDVNSLTLHNNGGSCIMSSPGSRSLILSDWNFESIRHISTISPMIALDLTCSLDLIFQKGHEIQSDLDATLHGEVSDCPAISFTFPTSSTISNFMIGYTSEHSLSILKIDQVEFSPVVEIRSSSNDQQKLNVFQIATFEEAAQDLALQIVCLVFHDQFEGHGSQDSSNHVGVDILVLNMTLNSPTEDTSSTTARISIMSRTQFLSNLPLLSLTGDSCYSLNDSSILLLRTTSAMYSTPDILVSFGDRIIGYRLDQSTAPDLNNASSLSQRNLLSTMFVIHTSQAGLTSSHLDGYIHSTHVCVVADRLITTCSNESTPETHDETLNGTIIHSTSLLVDLRSSLRYSSGGSTGVLMSASDKQLFLFNPNSHHSSISPGENLPSFTLNSPLHENRHLFDDPAQLSQQQQQQHIIASKKLNYFEQFTFSNSGLPVFPSQGAPPYLVTKLPKSLLFDLAINSCGISRSPKTDKLIFEGVGNSHHLGAGLILARESVGGVYFACTLDTLTFGERQKGQLKVTPLIWLHSLQTSKWKSIQPHRYPASPHSILFFSWKSYQRKETNMPNSFPESDSIGHPQNYPRTKKQYFNTKSELLSIQRMSWFGNHTLVLCTQRGQFQSSTTPNGNQSKSSQGSTPPPMDKHCCLELMTRKTVDPVIIKQATHHLPELPMETRRIAFPHLQCVIPLPFNFFPSHLDILPTKSHVEQTKSVHHSVDSLDAESSHSIGDPGISFRPPNQQTDEEVFQLRRSINRSNSGRYDPSVMNGKKNLIPAGDLSDHSSLATPSIESQDSCYLLLGSTTRFIALHITATTHLSDDEMNSIGANNPMANPSSRRKYSNTTNFQDFVSFYPSSYRVSIIWDLDVTTIPLYSPTLAQMSIHFPLHTAYLTCVQQLPTLSKGETHSRPSSAVEESNHSSVESLDSSRHNYCPVSLILLDRVGKVMHISLHNVNAIDLTFESIGTVITLGLCTSISRLHHYLFPVSHTSPATLQDIYYLHSQSQQSDELLWLPHAISPADHHAGGVILSAFKRPKSSFLFSPPTDNMCSYLTYTSPLKLIGLSLTLSPNQMMISSLLSTRPVLSLHSSSLPLIMLLSLINNARYLPDRTAGIHPSHPHPHPQSFISTLLIPFYTYSSKSTSWMKYMLSHLSLNPFPLQQLTEGLEIVLKSIINRPGFTRSNPDFAVLTSILFSCDDVLFIEIISRLSRKLEPHISASLFPLPNHHTTPSLTRLASQKSPPPPKANFYRGIVIRDSPWDQLTLFELCLSRCALQHASRFLTPACEQLGGSQTLESITASLILSHELLLECIRHLQLECALECLEFCMRLDVMAAEVGADSSLSFPSPLTSPS
jgi:hypothetical protein